MNDEIKNATFPVVVLGVDVVTGYENMNLLTSCFRALIGRYEGTELIDFHGRRWSINSAVEAHRLDPFWLRVLRNASAPIRIELAATEISPISLNALKEKVVKRLKMSSGWAVVTVKLVSEYNKTDSRLIINDVKMANSIETIVALLCKPLEGN